MLPCQAWKQAVLNSEKCWTERIKGMVVYTAGDLKDLLIEAGFSTIQVVHNKEEMYIIARK